MSSRSDYQLVVIHGFYDWDASTEIDLTNEMVSPGAQIIDLMMLVIDVTKGVQTQTAECLVIGEITCQNMVVVLNKLDMIPQEKQAATVDKVVYLMQ